MSKCEDVLLSRCRGAHQGTVQYYRCMEAQLVGTVGWVGVGVGQEGRVVHCGATHLDSERGIPGRRVTAGPLPSGGPATDTMAPA